MSKSWYPVLDYSLCSDCGACLNKCTHGVYNKNLSTNKPTVINPDGCIHGCRGCQKLCPVGAIQYVGDMGAKGTEVISCCD